MLLLLYLEIPPRSVFGARCTGFCAPATVELPAEIPARSVFGARCTDFCAWNNGALCPNSGIPARTLIFSFRSGVAFGGRGTAGGCFVTPCQGVFLIRRVSCGLACVPGTIACQTLDFFIRFRSDVWPGQRDCRRLFRHAVSCGLFCVPGTIAYRAEGRQEAVSSRRARVFS